MTTMEILFALGGSLFFLLMALFIRQLLVEVKGLRHDLVEFRVEMVKSVGQLEVRVDHLEARLR